MDALAESWFASGQKVDDLYKGSVEDITKELREWVKARLIRNQSIVKLLWSFFSTNDTVFLLREKYGSIEDVRIAPFKAKHVKNVERVKVRRSHVYEVTRTEFATQEAKEDRYRQYVLALFFIATLEHRGFNWPGIPCASVWSEVDSEVCAFLQSQDKKFVAEKQLAALEMDQAFEKWHLEFASRLALDNDEDSDEETSDVDECQNHTEDNPSGPDIFSTASIGFTIQGHVMNTPLKGDAPDPVDVTALIPPPRSFRQDSSMDALSSIPKGSGEEADSGSEDLPEETPEAIAQRINAVLTIGQKPIAEKKSKTKIRNAQRRKAKARAKEAAKAQSLTGDDDHGLQKSTTDD